MNVTRVKYFVLLITIFLTSFSTISAHIGSKKANRAQEYNHKKENQRKRHSRKPFQPKRFEPKRFNTNASRKRPLNRLVGPRTLNNVDRTISPKINTYLQKNKIQPEVSECCESIVITQADFGPNADQIYFISSPGKYSFESDIYFNGSDPYTPAILILPGVDNVTIDLCEHTLFQQNSAILTYGIWIGITYFGSGVGNNNITIENGTITNFTGSAILAYSDTLDVIYSDLHFYNLNLLRNGIPGFDAEDSGVPGLSLFGNLPASVYPTASNFIIPEVTVFRNVIIENVNANESVGGVNGCAGILVQWYDNVVIRNCQANNSIVPFQEGIADSGAFGFVVYGVNLKMINCQGNDTRAEDPAIQQVGGLDHESSQNSYFQDCQFNNGYGVAAFIVNSNISINRNVVFENCQFNNNRGGSDAVQVYGAHGSGAPNLEFDGRNYKFINCQFNGSSFEDNPTQQALSLGGMILQNVSQITLENCECRDLKSNGNSYNAVDMWGFYLTSEATDIPSSIGNDNDIVIRDCIISNFSNVGGSSTVAIRTGGGNLLNAYGEQVVHYNTLVENCVVQKIFGSVNSDFYEQAPLSVNVAGVGDLNRIFPEGFYEFPGFPGIQGPPAKRFNTFIKNCTISDVHGVLDNDPQKVIPKSAGIIVESIENVIVSDNQVMDCDRGILFTGTNDILPGPANSIISGLETCFQLAETKQDALDLPPKFITIYGDYLATNKPGLGPFLLTPTIATPQLTAPITAVGGLANPLNACSGPATNVNGKIGIVQFIRGFCGSVALVNNAEAGGDVATILINSNNPPATFTGGSNQYNASISYDDGQALISALTNDPTIVLTITNNSFTAAGAIFTNVTRGNSVSITSSETQRNFSFLCTLSDLNKMGWQPGDKIVYNSNGGPDIVPLVNGSTYYLIVYRPGYVKRGLIENNTVSSCIVSGFEDTSPKRTKSVWLGNIAYCNGDRQKDNYRIRWKNKAPVIKGTPYHYAHKSKYAKANLSISCGSDSSSCK